MKRTISLLFLALCVVSFGSLGTISAAGIVAPVGNEQESSPTFTNSLSNFQSNWKKGAWALAGLYAASYYLPESALYYLNMAKPVMAVAGAVGVYEGANHLYNKLSVKIANEVNKPQSGLGKAAKELNHEARKGGATGVARKMGGALFGGMSAAARVELVEPTVADVAKRMKPAGTEISQLTKQLKNLVWTGLGVGAGLITLWFGSRIAYSYYERYISKPQLDYTYKKAAANGTIGTLSRQITVAPETRTRLNSFLRANLKMKESIYNDKSDALYRNLALYGPTGSGKRMFAQEMAHFARMDYYEIQWSAFNKFSKDGDAVRAIDKFFKSDIQSTPNGAVIYIDNAQLLFSDMRPSVGSGTTHIAQVIDALITHTEARSNKYMVIFGMTVKPTLSRDIVPIVDDIVEITLPGLAERKTILKNYRDLYFKASETQEAIMLGVKLYLNDTELHTIAQQLDKASAAELADFMKTLKIESELPVSEGLTPELITHLKERMERRYDELGAESYNSSQA